MWLDI